MTAFIEFRISGNMCLWHQAKNISPVQNSSHIKQLSIYFHGKSHKNQSIHIHSFLCQIKQLFSGGCQQGTLPEQILTRISRQAQFREYHDLCMHSLHLPYLFQNSYSVGFRISHTDLRNRCRNPDKSIFHLCLLSGLLFTGKPVNSNLSGTLSVQFFDFLHGKCIVRIAEMAVQFYGFSIIDHTL